MIKSLKKYQIQTTPFNATKDWSINNKDNDNLLLTEDDYPIALEFIDYGGGDELPSVNSLCDIALEQQIYNSVKLNEGLKTTGIFYPENDPKNLDGTYQRPIYNQIKTVFYNNYLDPIKIFGLENIDFELSKTKKLLSDKFILFNIPKNIFGDKIIPNSINIIDTTLDNDYIFTDDGNGNLLAGTNIFSHYQEIGEYENNFEEGSSSFCNYYWNNITLFISWDNDSDVWDMDKIVGPVYWDVF